MRELDSDNELLRSHTDTVQTEYTRWYKEPRVPSNTDIIQFWTSKAYDYPIMARMMRNCMAAPAASAAMERVFNHGADIITD